MQQVNATWVAAGEGGAEGQAGPRVAAVCAAASLAAAIAANSAPSTLQSVILLVVAPLVVGVLIWWLLVVRALVAAMLLGLLSFAYLPSAWDALSIGFPRSVLRVTSHGLSWAFMAFATQLVVTSLAGLGENSRAARQYVERALALLAPRRADAFMVALFGFLAITFVGAVRDGQWSFYAPGVQRVDEMRLAGGVRFALLYPSTLLACSAVVGAKLAQRAVWADPTRRYRWMAIGLTVVGLVFAAQARRLMLASFALLVLPQVAYGGRLAAVPVRRLLTMLALVGAAMMAMLYGSNLWRASLRHRTHSTVAHVQQMTQESVGADEAIHALRSRLTYLWMDAAIMELHAHRDYSPLIERAFVTELVVSTPGMFFPDKYRFPRMSCETVMGAGGALSNDLPCTPIAEGVLYGGLTGLVVVLFGWGLAVWISSALYGTGSEVGGALAAYCTMPLITIEGGAFPIVQCLRSAIMGAAFVLPMAWVCAEVMSWFERRHAR